MPRQMWEYLCIPFDSAKTAKVLAPLKQDQMNTLGLEGWELVAEHIVLGTLLMTFKRPVAVEPEADDDTLYQLQPKHTYS